MKLDKVPHWLHVCGRAVTRVHTTVPSTPLRQCHMVASASSIMLFPYFLTWYILDSEVSIKYWDMIHCLLEENRLAVSTSECKQYFGYLSERERGEEIPEQCITCQKIIGCMLYKLKTSSTKAQENREWHSGRTYVKSHGTLGRRQKLPPIESLLNRWSLL